jgi:hypothetical protein
MVTPQDRNGRRQNQISDDWQEKATQLARLVCEQNRGKTMTKP